MSVAATSSEPTRADVLEWLASNPGRGQAECITALWGHLPDGAHARVVQRVKSWCKRARKVAAREAAGLPAPRRGRPPKGGWPESPPSSTDPAKRTTLYRLPAERFHDRDEPDPRLLALPPHELVGAERIPFLEAQLSLLLKDVKDARETKQLRIVPSIQTRIDAVRQALDDARAVAARQGVKLDRSVAAVAKAVKERQVLIDRLAEKAGEG